VALLPELAFHLLLSVPDQLVLNQTRLASQLGRPKLGLAQAILALRNLKLSHPSRLVMGMAQELGLVPHLLAGV
jgi:hypothetical protein